jgi:hypothetical protein
MPPDCRIRLKSGSPFGNHSREGWCRGVKPKLLLGITTPVLAVMEPFRKCAPLEKFRIPGPWNLTESTFEVFHSGRLPSLRYGRAGCNTLFRGVTVRKNTVENFKPVFGSPAPVRRSLRRRRADAAPCGLYQKATPKMSHFALDPMPRNLRRNRTEAVTNIDRLLQSRLYYKVCELPCTPE